MTCHSKLGVNHKVFFNGWILVLTEYNTAVAVAQTFTGILQETIQFIQASGKILIQTGQWNLERGTPGVILLDLAQKKGMVWLANRISEGGNNSCEDHDAKMGFCIH